MRYDFYAKGPQYKPALAAWCRRRLHRRLLGGLGLRSVLEVGVGLGEFARYCRAEGIAYVGVEPNAHLRRALQAEGHEVLDGTMLHLPCPARAVDAVFAAHVIEHLNSLPEAEAFLAGCRAILAGGSGRYLVLLYPDITRCGTRFWSDYTHNFVTSRERIEQMLADHDWVLERSGHYTACFFRAAGLVSMLGRMVPAFLFGPPVARFVRLSSQCHAYTIARCVDAGAGLR